MHIAMSKPNLVQVTVIYYLDHSLELLHQVCQFHKSETSRVIIPDDYKTGKSIIAVCQGEIEIINKVGDRILSVGDVA